MDDALTFVQLGFRHITNLGAMDHILFLLALAAIYRFRDWRDTLWVVTAFTVGHSITLLLAVTGALRIPGPVVEFLIPLTIVATCIENIVVRDHKNAPWGGRYRPVFAGIFGLVHGAGFATYLQNLFLDHIAVPLLGFNIGIELGQLVVLGGAFALLAGVDAVIAKIRMGAVSPLRIRTVALSAVIFLVASRWAIERAPW
ncbi:MAG: HupE/UreJ family protein [Gemmatimonadota bacterium]|nr:HupE/UreJ family protein [Gemmatimonadota bacterium]